MLQYFHRVYGKQKAQGAWVGNCDDLKAVVKYLTESEDKTWKPLQEAYQTFYRGVDMKIFKPKGSSSTSMVSPYNSMSHEKDNYGQTLHEHMFYDQYYHYDYIQPSNDISFYNELAVLMLSILMSVGFVCICVLVICIVFIGFIWKWQRPTEPINVTSSCS